MKNTIIRAQVFPALLQITVEELGGIVAGLSKNKQLPTTSLKIQLFGARYSYMNDEKIAIMFTSLWDQEVTNTKKFERHVTVG